MCFISNWFSKFSIFLAQAYRIFIWHQVNVLGKVTGASAETMRKNWVAQKPVTFILTCKMFTIGVEVQRKGKKSSWPTLEAREAWLLEKKIKHRAELGFLFCFWSNVSKITSSTRLQINTLYNLGKIWGKVKILFTLQSSTSQKVLPT